MTALAGTTGYTYERLFETKAGTVGLPDGSKLFVSFQTIVGFKRPGKVPAFTTFWSRSEATKDHIARWMREPANAGSVRVEKDDFDGYVARFFGLSAGYQHAPVWFADKQRNYAIEIKDKRWREVQP